MGKIFKWLLKIFVFGAIFWSVYAVLPQSYQTSIDRLTDGPLYAFYKTRYEIYKFALEFFGETHELAQADSEMYKPVEPHTDQRSEAERDYDRLSK